MSRYAVLDVPPYTGFVANGGRICDSGDTTHNFWMTRSIHTASDDITQLQLVFANWHIQNTGEVSGGTAATITASIEYPTGTFTRVYFSGAAAGVCGAGALLVSDNCGVRIPAGAKFFVRNYRVHAAGSFACPYVHVGTSAGNALGDAANVGTTSAVTDQTGGGTVVASNGTLSAPPAGIIALTKKPSVFIIGDSRVAGQPTAGDASTSSSPAVGELCRSYYANGMGYCAAPCASDQASFWTQALRPLSIQLGAYASSIVSNHSINDISNGASAATLLTRLAAVYAVFGNKSMWIATIAPHTSSTDSFATTANQTPSAQEAQRVAFNTSLRAGTTFTGCAGYADIASITESDLNSGDWIVTGVANGYTQDGLHENTAANTRLMNSGVVAPQLVTIVSNLVVNVVQWDGLTPWSYSGVAIRTDTGQIGQTYANGVFT